MGMRPARSATGLDRRQRRPALVHRGTTDRRPAISACIAVRRASGRTRQEGPVRPASVAWTAGLRILRDTGRIDEGGPAPRHGETSTAPPASSSGPGPRTGAALSSASARSRQLDSARRERWSSSRSPLPSPRRIRKVDGGAPTRRAHVDPLLDALLSGLWICASSRDRAVRTHSSARPPPIAHRSATCRTNPSRSRRCDATTTSMAVRPGSPTPRCCRACARSTSDAPRAKPDSSGCSIRTGPARSARPDLSRMVYADGKVVTPLFEGAPGRSGSSTGPPGRSDRPGPSTTPVSTSRAPVRRRGPQVGDRRRAVRGGARSGSSSTPTGSPPPVAEAAVAMDCFRGSPPGALVRWA